MFVEQFVWTIPLAGSSRPEWGFWPTLLGGFLAAWAAKHSIIIGIREVKDCWRIVTTDRMAIDEAITANGLVQIQGRVHPTQPDDAVMSPILNKECVAYEYNIKKYGSNIIQAIQGNDSGPVDSGNEYRSFIISDGSGKISVDPNKESLLLDTTTETLSTKKEQTDDSRLKVEPTSYRFALGETTKPVKLTEGTIEIGEKITIIGRPIPESEEAITGVDAVITPEEGHLTVIDDAARNVAKKKARQGALGLILGLGFSFFAIVILRIVILDIV